MEQGLMISSTVAIAKATVWLAVLTAVLAIISISGFIYTFFRDKRKPSLKMSLDLIPPHSHKTELRDGRGTKLCDVFYIRLRVFNEGKISAKDVEVFATSLKIKSADGDYRDVPLFMPMNLKWSHVHMFKESGERFAMFYPQINPGGILEAKHCDIFHIIDPTSPYGRHFISALPGLLLGQTFMLFDQIVKPNTEGYLHGPGNYRLGLSVSAGNAEPERSAYEINLTGNWYSDEGQMFEKGVGIKKV